MLTDEEITKLVEVKKLYTGKASALKWQSKLKNKTLDIPLSTEDGKMAFVIYARQNEIHENNFSCGIRLVQKGKDDLTLARYNGSSHVHVNHIEKDRFEFVCHIHLATERHWMSGKKLEDYAILADRYSDLIGAVKCILMDYNVSGIHDGQLVTQGGLFDEI